MRWPSRTPGGIFTVRRLGGPPYDDRGVRLLTFDDAHSLGLVTEVWDERALGGTTFADAVQEYARQFTPPRKASKAVGRIKRAVQSGIESGFGEGLALERELQQLLFESDDAREGLAANLEKRKPKFSGR